MQSVLQMGFFSSSKSASVLFLHFDRNSADFARQTGSKSEPIMKIHVREKTAFIDDVNCLSDC